MAFVERFLISDEPKIIKAGEAAEFSFNTCEIPGLNVKNARVKLRLRGDVCLHPSIMYEGGLPYLYRDIDDALTQETHHSRYALKIQSRGEDWPRRAYYKIQCPPAINTQYRVPEGGGKWTFSCWVRAEGLDLKAGGRASVVFERFLKKDGVDIRDINDSADETIVLDFPQGTYDWMKLECPVSLDEQTAVVLATIAVEHASGTIWIEEPWLANGHGFNILPVFDQTDRFHECFNWYGENLSQKEWTDLRLTVNGTTIPDQSIFQRCFAGSENELKLPDGLLHEGENTIGVKNVSDYNAPLPYKVQRAELLVEKKAPVRIVWCPEIVNAGKEFGILLKTYEPGVRISVTAGAGLVVPGEFVCESPGLHVLKVKAEQPAGGLGLTVEALGHTETVTDIRAVERLDDGVLAGSGDSIYVPQDITQMEDFLVWYLENGLGNMLTFRPVYRWSGTRECNEQMWKHIIRLCNDLGLHYCHIIDGRELPGLNANPSKAMLAGEGFIGNQAHERDGALYYWLQRKGHSSDVLFEELSHRIFKHPDYAYHLPIIYDGDNVYLCFSPTAPKDMREAAQQFVEKARYVHNGIKRHTGPSMLFKYLFQAGVEVGGAELMYGPLEVALAALRGASIAYDREAFAAHLAVQWGTTPHDTEERYRRYQLALFVSYLQGVSHINTEEGLYRMEEMFAVLDRFSEPCIRHGEVERDFVRFISSHTRRGTMHRGIALLHGAYDGWACFCRRNVWAQEGTQWEFATPEESWDLIQVFYPDSVLDAIYRHPCPNAPQGYYTRTPYGSVDILPVEADAETMCSYHAMAFLGWNTADEGQIERLTEYVEKGGTLILGWAHLCTDVKREDVFAGNVHPLDASRLTGVKLLGFEQKRNGNATHGRVELSESASVLQMENDNPLVVQNILGKGKVLFVNALEYPADPSVRSVYEELLSQIGEQERASQCEKGMLTSEDTVETTIYECEDGNRVIYAINTDWYSAEKDSAKAMLHVGNKSYPVEVQRGKIHIFTVCGNMAAETCDPETEVIALWDTENGVKIKAQGAAGDCVKVYVDGGYKEYRLEQDGITIF